MRLAKGRKGVSPVVGVMLMLVATVILAAVVSSFAGSLGGEEAKAPQLAISAEAKSGDSIMVHHESGDPVYLGSIEVRTFIPEGTYKDMSYKVDMSKVTEIGNGNGVIETGESFKINWNDAFATSAYGLMAPNPGERVVIEIYEKGGDKPIAKTTAVVRP
ncbi:MAG: Archaeal flagellin [Candidatus Alkanophagales archaeon MCA70_species_2]|nr:Archaeal flagellin [Candidatus Alkanophaga liquidiphilum]